VKFVDFATIRNTIVCQRRKYP